MGELQNFFQFSSINLWNTISKPRTVYILIISLSSSTKWCDMEIFRGGIKNGPKIK